jgi:hypothetical protein
MQDARSAAEMLEHEQEKQKAPIWNDLLRDYPLPGKDPAKEGIVMPDPRRIVDCRNFPSERNCTLAISGVEES